MNNTYCSALFNHIYSDNSDTYQLCCFAKNEKNKPVVSASNVGPFEWFFSDQMEEYRDKVLSGEKIPACKTCYKMEEAECPSYRMTRFKSHKKFITYVKDVELKLRIFGNYCNLSCYTCHPYNSSSREKELKEIGLYERYGSRLPERAPTKKQYEKIAQDVLNNIHLVGKIIFTGGEPLLLPRHHDFVDKIKDTDAENINVSYMTNFTELNHKGVYFLDKVKKFKTTEFCISCDHYGDKLSYIRYPINVTQFEKNLDTLIEERIKTNNSVFGQIHLTVSILNVEDLYEIKNYYQTKFGLNVIFAGAVRSPKDFCVSAHPKRKQLIEKYKDDKKLEETMFHLKQDAPTSYWNNAIRCFELLDKKRGTDFRKLWPEYDYIDLINHKFIDE